MRLYALMNLAELFCRADMGGEGGFGSGDRPREWLPKLYLNPVHAQEAAMKENCEKTFMLQAQKKTTLLCFLIDLFEMHLEVLGSFCF